jgi:hypothetical protein
MKLVRLPSGPLACVFPVDETEPVSQGKDSGVYRAFSGSVEAAGDSEHGALEALDEQVRRLSQPPPAELELNEHAANDVASWGPGLANTTGRHERYSEPDTLPAPASASRR